jgi:hypothetical protein
VFEVVENMSQRELDHLKGRECGSGEGCKRCDRIRRALDGEEIAANVRLLAESPEFFSDLIEDYG